MWLVVLRQAQCVPPWPGLGVGTEAASWCQQSVAGPGNQKLSSEGAAELSRYTGAPADTWHAVTRAGEARHQPQPRHQHGGHDVPPQALPLPPGGHDRYVAGAS